MVKKISKIPAYLFSLAPNLIRWTRKVNKIILPYSKTAIELKLAKTSRKGSFCM
jgi:hypothetical protein